MDDVEVWKERIRCAPDEDLLALRDADYLGLRSLAFEKWTVVIQATEAEIQLRGLTI